MGSLKTTESVSTGMSSAPLPPISHGKVLDIIRSEGPVSRVEIADFARLTQASVSTIVRTLLNDGLVIEVGTAISTGGKRRTLLEVSPSARCAVGVHLGRDSLVYVITNMKGGMIGRERRAGAGSDDPAAVVTRMADEIETLIRSLGVARSAVVGVGVVSAGPLDYTAGTVVGSGEMRAWSSFPLRDSLAEAMGLPVVVDKDATAAALGEFWGGSVDAPLSFACLYMGMGIGSGIVSGGTAFRGSASNAGEIGHVSLDIHGVECYCGNRGCLETFAAPAAVVANAIARGFPLEDDHDDVTGAFDTIARLAVQRDPEALRLIEESASAMAEGALTLANLTDVDVIVLGGPGFAIAGALYVEAIRTTLARRFFARGTHGIDVRLSTNARDAAALGASALVLQQSLAPRG